MDRIEDEGGTAMKLIYILTSLEDEPVIAFESREEAELAGKSDGLSCVISCVPYIEGGSHENMPTER